MQYQSKRYGPVLDTQEGSVLWGNTLINAILHEQNGTMIRYFSRKFGPLQTPAIYDLENAIIKLFDLLAISTLDPRVETFSKKFYTSFVSLLNEVLIVINFPKITYFKICVQQTTLVSR